MTPGKLYMLRGVNKNKKWNRMVVHKGYGDKAQLFLGEYRSYHNCDFYGDGEVFLCVSVTPSEKLSGSPSSYTQYWTQAYADLLAPNGKIVTLQLAGNKTKFREVKSKKPRTQE